MTILKAMDLIRNWSLLVDHDIPDDEIACMAQLISSETEKEMNELVKHLEEKARRTPCERAVEAAWEKSDR